MSRPSREDLYVSIAELFAARSTCIRAGVGAVLVRDGRIIAAGYNGAPSGLPHCSDVGCLLPDGPEGGCKRAIHAEANALIYAARVGVPTIDSTLYTTHSPCASCSRLLVAAGIVRVVYLNAYRRDDINMLLDAGVKVQQYGVNQMAHPPVVPENAAIPVTERRFDIG